MKKFSLLGVLVFILTGCAGLTGWQGEVPTVADRGKAGKVVVVRISSFFAVLRGYGIALDGKEILGIGSGEYTEFLVPEGEHEISVTCSQPVLTPLPEEVEYEDTLRFVIHPSEPVYFLVSPSWKCAKIRRCDEEEAKRHMEGGTFIDLEQRVGQ